MAAKRRRSDSLLPFCTAPRTCKARRFGDTRSSLIIKNYGQVKFSGLRGGTPKAIIFDYETGMRWTDNLKFAGEEMVRHDCMCCRRVSFPNTCSMQDTFQLGIVLSDLPACLSHRPSAASLHPRICSCLMRHHAQFFRLQEPTIAMQGGIAWLKSFGPR